MITKLVAVNDVSDDDSSWTVTDQNGEYIFDAESLEEVVEKAKTYLEFHDFTEIVIPLD